jgi:hypothetical protein
MGAPCFVPKPQICTVPVWLLMQLCCPLEYACACSCEVLHYMLAHLRSQPCSMHCFECCTTCWHLVSRHCSMRYGTHTCSASYSASSSASRMFSSVEYLVLRVDVPARGSDSDGRNWNAGPGAGTTGVTIGGGAWTGAGTGAVGAGGGDLALLGGCACDSLEDPSASLNALPHRLAVLPAGGGLGGACVAAGRTAPGTGSGATDGAGGARLRAD